MILIGLCVIWSENKGIRKDILGVDNLEEDT